MPKIKLIVTDLDDTFLDGEYAPDMNVAAIKHAREAGIAVVPATGRPWPMAEEVVRGYDFANLCVVSNGAALIETDTGSLRYRNRIPTPAIRPLLEAGDELGLDFDVSCWNKIVMPNKQLGAKKGRLYDIILDRLCRQGRALGYDTVDELVEACAECAELVRFFIPKGADVGQRLAEQIADIEGIEYARSFRYHLDVVASGAGKGSVLPILADIYDISMDNIMALGDQMNDASMLQAAGLGVAVGNADARLKAVADRVTASNKEAGFAQAVYEFALKG